MKNSSETPDLLCLDPGDNVLVLTRSVRAGDAIPFGDRTFGLEKPLDLGHKIAARDIKAGEQILKYGVPIGSASQDIRAGEHVHLHNMKSDYLPTYTLEEGRKFVRDQ